MSKIVELNIAETDAVVGGAALAVSAQRPVISNRPPVIAQRPRPSVNTKLPIDATIAPFRL